MKKVIAVAGVAAILLAAGSYFSPHLTLYQMKNAIDNRDADSFSEHVDFPALRESVKGQMMAMIDQEMSSPDMEKNPFAGIGKAMATALIGPMIDSVVTPAGVIAMMKSGDPKPDIKKIVATKSTAEKTPDFSVSYQAWGRVKVQRADAAGNDGGFILKRQGLWSWKLSSIELPDSILKAPK